MLDPDVLRTREIACEKVAADWCTRAELISLIQRESIESPLAKAERMRIYEIISNTWCCTRDLRNKILGRIGTCTGN